MEGCIPTMPRPSEWISPLLILKLSESWGRNAANWWVLVNEGRACRLLADHEKGDLIKRSIPTSSTCSFVASSPLLDTHFVDLKHHVHQAEEDAGEHREKRDHDDSYVDKPNSGNVVELTTASVALTAAIEAQKPYLLSKNMLSWLSAT